MANQQETRSRRNLIGIFALLAVLILIVGVASYRLFEADIYDREIQRLRSIADIKSEQISAWYRERMADAEVLSGRPTALTVLAETQGDHGDRTRRSLTQMQVAYGYRAIELFDPAGRRIAVAGADVDSSALRTAEVFERLAKYKVPEFIDFYTLPGNSGAVGMAI